MLGMSLPAVFLMSRPESVVPYDDHCHLVYL